MCILTIKRGKYMDMYPRYQSRSGYFNQDDQTDGYGVDHSGFSLRDELLYQTARKEREQELFENFNRQGVDENYPRLGTSFWGNSADNYGFGRSNIENNIKKRQFTPVPDNYAYKVSPKIQKRVYADPTPQKPTAGDIVIEGLKGFGEGIENGSLAFFNALTGGAYDVFSYSYMNNDYAKRQEKMQKLAESANLGREYKLANYAIDTGGKVEFIKNIGLLKFIMGKWK